MCLYHVKCQNKAIHLNFIYFQHYSEVKKEIEFQINKNYEFKLPDVSSHVTEC